MPSKPAVMPPEDEAVEENGELKWNDDLQTLAEQLQRDAADFAACYPCSDGRADQMAAQLNMRIEPSRTWRPRRFSVGRSAAAAVLLVLAGGLGWMAGSMPPAVSIESHFSRVPRTPESDSAVSGSPQLVQQEAAETSEPGEEAMPAWMVRELSGPELEGVLDLLEGKHASVSI